MYEVAKSLEKVYSRFLRKSFKSRVGKNESGKEGRLFR